MSDQRTNNQTQRLINQRQGRVPCSRYRWAAAAALQAALLQARQEQPTAANWRACKGTIIWNKPRADERRLAAPGWQRDSRQATPTAHGPARPKSRLIKATIEAGQPLLERVVAASAVTVGVINAPINPSPITSLMIVRMRQLDRSGPETQKKPPPCCQGRRLVCCYSLSARFKRASSCFLARQSDGVQAEMTV
jgi:hypothetical protein